MTHATTTATTLPEFDAELRALVRLAAVVAAGDDTLLRRHVAIAAEVVRAQWVEELILQSYLFAGFPRALNATREWRRSSGVAAPETDEGEDFTRVDEWAERGAETCAIVYGPFYEKLRKNIRELHPALDSWMIVEGYGKVLSRPALPLWQRELCIVAACAASAQERQLHSHLHGALHAGATRAHVEATLASLSDLITSDRARAYALLWSRVAAAHSETD